MGAITFIIQPMQFSRLQPPDETMAGGGGQYTPALFVTEMQPIPMDQVRAMPEGIAWSIPAPDDQLAPNRLISGDYLSKLDRAVADTLAQATSPLAGPTRILCKRAFDGALTLVIATQHGQSLVDSVSRLAPGVGAFYALNPWEALEAATPTLSEAIEARAFWPVLKQMVAEGEDMTQPRQIRLVFAPRNPAAQGGLATPPESWPALTREAVDIGFTTQATPNGGLHLDAVTVLSSEEVNKMAVQVGLWIERYGVAFEGWEAENLQRQKQG